MNKGVLVLVGLVLLVGGYLFARPNDATTNTTSPPTPIESEAQADTRYMNFSKSAFDQSRGKKRVYYFHAPWCPTCVPTDKEFQENSLQIPEDVILFKTDYDSEADLKKQYAITYQHTFVLVDEDGIEVKKWNGGGIAELIANTQ